MYYVCLFITMMVWPFVVFCGEDVVYQAIVDALYEDWNKEGE